MLGGHAADRTAFLSALDTALARDPGAVAVARLDLDRFSRIRENFGSVTARAVRMTLLDRLDEIVGSGEHVLRYGEDAFVAILPVVDASAEGLERVAMGVIERMSAPMDMGDGLEIAVGCNVGIAAAARFDESDPLRLLTGAELAIQRANAIGSRRAIVYEVVPREDPTRIPGLYADMLGAVRTGQFQPVFQPFVALPDRTIRGAEALVRWLHPQHGAINPGEFVAEAESSGLIRDIDAQIRDLSVHEAAGWPGDLVVSVNLSAADLDVPHLADDVAAALRTTGLPAQRLVLEVTETALSQDWSAARRRLESLRALGVRIAVDDFGTGHMFLDRLSTGLFQILKIDRSLIAPTEEDAARRSRLLSAVVSMARTLDMSVVAEGVETEEQLARVEEAGCDRAQGYLFSPPVPPEAFAAMVAAGSSL